MRVKYSSKVQVSLPPLRGGRGGRGHRPPSSERPSCNVGWPMCYVGPTSVVPLKEVTDTESATRGGWSEKRFVQESTPKCCGAAPAARAERVELQC
jgi:hypothetical protein